MGMDLQHAAEQVKADRAKRYVDLKKVLCGLVGLTYEPDKTGPGEDVGPSDFDLYCALANRPPTCFMCRKASPGRWVCSKCSGDE